MLSRVLSCRSLGSRRCLSVLRDPALVRVEQSGNIASITMCKKPVNSLNLEMIQSLTAAIAEVEASEAQGFVLTSEMKTIFSAGLEINEMYKPERARLEQFWGALQDLWLALYGTPLAAVAAIDGHAPAGGCLMAACTDHRVMAEGKFGIGLNETQLGIVAPFWFVDTVVPLMGPRHTDRMLQLGEVLSPEDALRTGLVDELCPHGQTEEVARAVLAKYVKIDADARAKSKMLQRTSALERLRNCKEADIEQFVDFACSDKVQGTLGAYLEALSQRKKSK